MSEKRFFLINGKYYYRPLEKFLQGFELKEFFSLFFWKIDK